MGLQTCKLLTQGWNCLENTSVKKETSREVIFKIDSWGGYLVIEEVNRVSPLGGHISQPSGFKESVRTRSLFFSFYIIRG